jgi:hypothetical protein
MMFEYHLEDDEEENGCETEFVVALGNTDFLSSFSARVASKRPPAMRSKSELDRYATLRRIAKDIFANHATTVASKSAFSTSGRVLSEHRNRLTFQMLEALMCSQKLDSKQVQRYLYLSSSYFLYLVAI